jgi:hypothetical protein
LRKKWFKSTTTWATIWCVGILTYALITKVDLPWWNGVSVALAGAIVTYVGGTKIIDYKHGPETESEDKGGQ